MIMYKNINTVILKHLPDELKNNSSPHTQSHDNYQTLETVNLKKKFIRTLNIFECNSI